MTPSLCYIRDCTGVAGMGIGPEFIISYARKWGDIPLFALCLLVSGLVRVGGGLWVHGFCFSPFPLRAPDVGVTLLDFARLLVAQNKYRGSRSHQASSVVAKRRVVYSSPCGAIIKKELGGRRPVTSYLRNR